VLGRVVLCGVVSYVVLRRVVSRCIVLNKQPNQPTNQPTN